VDIRSLSFFRQGVLGKQKKKLYRIERETPMEAALTLPPDAAKNRSITASLQGTRLYSVAYKSKIMLIMPLFEKIARGFWNRRNPQSKNGFSKRRVSYFAGQLNSAEDRSADGLLQKNAGKQAIFIRKMKT